MKAQADKKRSERVFKVGEYVFLRRHPYVHSLVAHRASHKLNYRYYGPFKIIAKIREITYKLQLPEASRIRPIIHVS